MSGQERTSENALQRETQATRANSTQRVPSASTARKGGLYSTETPILEVFFFESKNKHNDRGVILSNVHGSK